MKWWWWMMRIHYTQSPENEPYEIIKADDINYNEDNSNGVWSSYSNAINRKLYLVRNCNKLFIIKFFVDNGSSP